jgi:hypothetical protein
VLVSNFLALGNFGRRIGGRNEFTVVFWGFTKDILRTYFPICSGTRHLNLLNHQLSYKLSDWIRDGDKMDAASCWGDGMLVSKPGVVKWIFLIVP